MTTIHDAYINALLADATYALTTNKPNGYTHDDLKNLLSLSTRMTSTLAQYIGDNFTVVTHIDSDDLTGSGFDATVWRSNDGKVYISMTGTEGLQDFLSDVDLAVSSGTARAQLAEMVNWWLKISTPTTSTAAQVTLVPIYDNSVPPQINYEFQSAPSVQGLGLLDGVTNVEVNGHSLGGHLASAFARLFGASANSTGNGLVAIDHITTFNSAGFNGNSNLVFQEIEQLLGIGLGRMPTSAEQTNDFAINGLNITTNTFFSSQIGQRVEVFNEESTGIPNHYLYKLTDALALGDAIAKLDSSFDINKMNLLFDKGANKTEASLEGILDGLRKTLLGSSVTPSPIGDAGDSPSSRNDYHDNLAFLLNSDGFKNLIGKVTLTDTPSTAGEARNDFGAFLSLVHLTPFALKANSIEATVHLQTDSLTNTELALKWEQDKTLTPEQLAGGEGNYSDMWLTDRAHMLAQMIQRNTDDSVMVVGGGINETYQDIATGQMFSTSDVGYTGPGLPPDSKHYVFGDDNANPDILGGAKADHLYGGGGNDILQGNSGNDYLEGGQGNDSYRINSGDGTDTILDADGQGSIVYNGLTLSGGQIVAPNQWQDSKGRVYTLSDMGAGKQDLLIDAGTEHLIVKDYSNGELGIRLTGEVAPTSFSQSGSGITVIGDLMPYQMPWNYYLWLANPAWPYLFDSNGNMVRINVPQPFYADKIFDTAGDDNLYAGDGLNVIYAYNGGNNHIETGANDDYINGGSGRDRVYAGGMTDIIDTGAGDDIVYGEDGGDVINGGLGNDYLSGGAGADAINGGGGNDQVYGGHSISWQQAATDSGIAAAGKGDLLTGGSGNDVVIGATADDALLGGDGSDTVAGREGNDILLGDSDLVFVAPPLSEFDAIIGATRWPMGPYTNFHSPYTSAPMLNIQFEKIDHGPGSVDRYQVKLSSLANPEAPSDNWMTQAITGGNDQLYGGTGDDWLSGELGDDLLNGGADNDVLVGGAGNDILIGGKGDDIMLGGAGNDTYIINANDGIDYIYDDNFSGTNSLVFSSEVDPANIKLFQGSLGLDLGNGTVVHINGVDYNDVANTSSIQRFEFANGTVLTAQQLVARGFDLNGTGGSDTVSGTNATDRIVAGAGDDIVSGGAGNDILDGGAGNDSYVFNPGDGADEIIDTAGGVEINTLILGTGITAAMITPVIDADAMVTLDFGNGDSVRIQQMGKLSIQNVRFADGSVIATESLLNAPPVATPDAITVYEDGGVMTMPTSTLLVNDTDPNINDVLSIIAVGASAMGAAVQLADGQVLYDIGNRFQALGVHQTLSDSFSYTISDSKGGTASAEVTVTIAGINDAPVAAIPLSNQAAAESGTFAYQIPVNAFTDVDTGDRLSYRAALTNGNPLPDWLAFDSGSRTFNGTLPEGSAGLWDISVTATDSAGAGASATFKLDVANLVTGTSKKDHFNGTALRDIVYGLAGKDSLRGADAADVLVGGSDNDLLDGGSGDDVLIGGIPDVVAIAGTLVPLETNKRGKNSDDDNNDARHDKPGNNLLNGGAGDDTLIGGGKNDLLIGGTGNDTIDVGTGANIIAFNRGDGQDTVLASTGKNTLSLGSQITLSDLSLRHLGNDLILEIRQTGQAQDRITFRDWYLTPDNRSIDNLQMIGPTEPKTNKIRVDRYDFDKWVESFDKAVAANTATDPWPLINAKPDKYLEQFKGKALGGDLVYQYGSNGSLAGISLETAQDLLDSSSFAVNPQELHKLPSLSEGSMWLS